MVRRIRILVLLLVSGVSVAASGADNSASANDESHSSLPDLASESAKKEEQENKGKSFKEQGADYFINSATQGFDNLTPEALESQARSYLQNQITSSAQSYLEGVMSPYGKIRTSLSVGEGGDLDGSSLDYFIPWYDNQSTLFFSQISAQRKEDRTIGNFGLGVRQNVGNWLLGGNAFYDYDFTRGHRRLGLGTEAWTDYLKFSGNYYHPLSDWKDSEDFDFYEERPARGWDIRMESWLPFYPQLGAKLVYEQYYGDEVALFGTDNLQKDPHAVTLGLEYTPVPLVTVGTDYKAGTGDSNDFSVNATVNYQIGTPLAAQLDPENVKIQHSLMGSRTDFVDRNNFIILEYREKDPLDVTLWLKADATNEHPECVIEDTPEAAVGLEKCKWTVNALINHHYKIISASWQAKNNATLVIEQPQGVGLLTPLSVLPVNSLITTPVNRSVKFTVATSPDTPEAQMWGHMADTLTVGDMKFQRPKLAAEATAATRTQEQDNETWARVSHADALNNPNAGGCEAGHLPRADQLAALYASSDGNKIHTVSGWPTEYDYWSSTFASAATWQAVSLAAGGYTASGDASDYVSCLVSKNPTAASITIEPVDAALWYNANSEHAVKVKKGDTLQLKVTVKDASGNPLPQAPFVLSRGDGYTRQGEKHIAGSGDGIVSAVVIDGDSLNDTATKIGGMTGENGSKIINVTRPDTHGTKVAITAALYDNASATASIDTIFTVVTSPDSDKAKMWGHMPETTTAANGEVFKRPLLSAEIASGVTHGDNTENNEAWGIVDFEMANDACGAGYVPTLADMQSLYDARPGGAMNTQQGWPLDGKNYQDSTADLSRSTQNRYVKSINLRDGGVGSLLWNEQLYFVCLQNAHPAATQITLTSPVYNDSDGFAKAKVGETIPVIITTRDAQGNPAADTPVIFTRGDSVGRANQEVNSSAAADIQINHSDGRSSGANYYTATGADGTLTLNISQDSGAGFKTPLTAAIEHNGVTSAPLPVIFTVLTSPDTPKANYWGHMAETLTDSSGVAYRRPLLASEFSATPGKTLTIANGYYDKGETWGMITVDKAWNGTGGGCGRDTLPTVANLQTLYGTYPDNAMRSRNGWPMTSSGNNNVSRYWWAGDYVISSDGTKSLYAAVNLFNDGNDVKTTTSTSMYYMQTCLASPRSAAASLTLTLAGQDETTGSAKAKKGEQMAATIDVKDAAGQPMKNVMVKISRGSSYNRANSATSSSSITDDITLRNVMPSGLATYLLDTSAKYLYAQTDAQGQVTFTLAQDSTAGLKTTISAATMDGSNLTDSKDAIFTVVTSPDSDKAKYWGHMPETFTNSKGVEFKRPLLRAELSSTADTSGYTENNETWYTWSRYPNMYQDTASPCDRLGLPTVNDLQTLYTDYPNGALTTTLGLPVASGKYWGAGNSVPDATHSDSQFQYVRLSDNNTLTTKANTATAQLCLAKRRDLSIELTSSDMDADKGAPVAKKGESLPLTVTVRDGSGTPQPNTAIRLGRTLSIDRAGVVDGSSGGGMVLTSVAPSTGSMTFNCTVSSCTSYWYGITDEDGKAQLEVTQDDSRGLRTPLQAMLVDDPLTVSDMDVIFTVITSPDSDKAKYWGHMPETVTNSAGVKFRRPLLAAEMTSNSGTYLVNNETWPLVTAANTEKAGATGCDAEYQPLSGDLQTLYSDNPNGAIGTNYGWPVAGNKSWWAADRAPNTGYYQFINLNSGGKGTASSSTATGAQVCLVEPRTSTPASITLTSTAMDSAKNAAVVAKGSAMPLTVTVKDSSGNPVANVGFTLSRGDSKNRAGMVITDGDVAADAGADDLMLKELTPASASQSMTTTGIVFTGTTGSDGTATFTLNQDKSLGLKTPLTVKVTDNTTLHASLDVIFMVLTSPDTDKALFWGNMSDTTSVNGKTLHRPWLQAEMLSGVTPVFTNGVHANNEYWAMAHTVDNTKWDIAKQCGSLSKAPDNNDLLTLYHSISSLGWPTQGYPYLSKSTSSGGMYCGVDENTKSQNCAIKPAGSAGYATCVE
ncbi:hypothetical protein IV995_002991 [Salmonella enterica]|nr:hypothetical protein [Salmonella enterica]